MNIFLSVSNIQAPRNNFFCRNGSIVVDFTLFFRGFVELEKAAKPLQDAIKTGKLGSFTVDANSFSLQPPTTTSPSSAPSTAGGCSHLC